MSNAYFITASGTECGKSFVTQLLMAYAKLRGVSCAISKPVLSGANGQDDDAALLLKQAGQSVSEQTLDSICCYRFDAPLSPHRAAELEGRVIDREVLMGWCHDWLAAHRETPCLMEGVGGVMVPLTYDFTVCDWIRALSLPVLFVTGDYLGSISHSLTALHALYSADIPVAAHIVNQSPASVEHDNMCDTLRHLSPYDAPVLSLSRYAYMETGLCTLHQNYIEQHQEFFTFADSILL